VVPISASGTKADDHWFMRNGIPLSEIYHAAFDAHLIGIDPTAGFTCRNGC
jgi:hypothetical protein